MVLISKQLIAEIKEKLPKLRQEVEKDFIKLNDSPPGTEFYSDERVIAMFPFAALTALLMKSKVKINHSDLVWAINNLEPPYLEEIIIITLNQLALTSAEKATIHF